jgi:coproporphyrinogen III oxidase
MTPNPRVEGVMVSAPPQIAYYYKHTIEASSPENELMDILKTPIDWV